MTHYKLSTVADFHEIIFTQKDSSGKVVNIETVFASDDKAKVVKTLNDLRRNIITKEELR